MLTCTVTDQESGLKLIHFLHLKLKEKFSKKKLKALIDHYQCLVNGKVQIFSNTVLQKGDQITFYWKGTDVILNKPTLSADQVLYEDSDLFIFNKPAGITSENLLEECLMISQIPSLFLVHRLDRDTSGVILFSKNQQSYQFLIESFQKKEVKKIYYAIVDGVPNQNSGSIENYLAPVREYDGQKIWGVVQPKMGRYAKTIWKKIKTGNKASLLECQPITGKTHQLRVHLKKIGHPILGDFHYWRQFTCSYRPLRHLLHAKSIDFLHPTTKEPMCISSNSPKDFEKAFKALQIK